MAGTRLVIFDFDGTLADTQQGIVSCWAHTVKTMGLPEVPRETIAATIGLPLKESFAVGVPSDRLDEAVEIYHNAFNDIAFRTISTFDGIIPMLETLSSRGIRLAVASSRGNDSLLELCQLTGTGKYFELICGLECASRPKPAPDLVLHILDRLDVKASEAVVVGDATFDIGMGSSAGCRTIAVTWGNQTEDKLKTASPDHIVDRAEEILSLV